MSKRVGKWANKLANKCANEQMSKRQKSNQAGKWVSKWANEQASGQMSEWVTEQANEAKIMILKLGSFLKLESCFCSKVFHHNCHHHHPYHHHRIYDFFPASTASCDKFLVACTVHTTTFHCVGLSVGWLVGLFYSRAFNVREGTKKKQWINESQWEKEEEEE